MYNFINYKLRRNLLYEYISSIELDMRNFILVNRLDLSSLMGKISERMSRDNKKDSDSYDEQLLFLDFSDYVELINLYLKNNRLNSEIHNSLVTALKKLIPIRNRVMHSRPIKYEDESDVFQFVNNYKRFASIIEFSNLKSSIELIENNPNIFYEKNPNSDFLFIQNPIENNLPLVDYDDTGFIGREEKKRDIKKKLLGRYPVITIIGDGGIGKTSTALSLIYDFIDENDFPFEKVIWTSLKTKTLTDGEFKTIKQAIKSFDECIKKNDILNKEGITGIDDLLFYMSVYKTLLILDNLETINTNDVRKLFEDVPEGSKILITSRIGIGEFETRIVLTPFTKNEASVYFRRLTDAYGVDLLKGIKDDVLNNYVEKLYFSPLCIKWFIINVGKGNNPDIVIKNQDGIIEYCLSNVFEKLSTEAKNVLTIMMVKHKDFGMAEIVYINDKDYETTALAINELCACNFLQQVDRGIYNVPDFARKYLSSKINKTDVLFNEFLKRSNHLDGIVENLYHNDYVISKNKPLSLNPSSPSEKISTIYMLSFIESSNKQELDAMDDWFEKASKAAPSFGDLYKVGGYCYSKNNNNEKAKECFEIALSLVNDDNKAYIESIYSIFLNNQLGNYDEALKHINVALNIQPTNPYFLANYARILKYQKHFTDSKEIILNLLKSDSGIDDGFRRKMISEYVDLEFRIIDESGENFAKQKNRLLDLLTYIESIRTEFYFAGLYKCLRKIFDYLMMFSSNRDAKKIGNSFVKKYLPYILIFEKRKEDQARLISKINETFSLDYNFEDLYLKFDSPEIGYIRTLNFEEKYGSIKGKNTRYFSFYFTDINFDLDCLREDLKVVFVPKFFKQYWRASDISLPSLDKEEE